MAKAIWGLDFGDWSLKVVRGSYSRKSDALTLDLFDEIVYGELACGYEAGQAEKHRAGIEAFRAKYEIGPHDDLCVSVTGSEVFSRFINLPPVPESIGEIIRYEARQQIPFDIDEVVWDYQPVKEEHEIGEEIEVGLFALKKERVAELMDLLDPWRGNLRVVQDAPLALYNLLVYEGLVDQPAVVLDMGSATTDVLVINPPRYWVRTLLVAGDDLTNALVEQFGITVAEAETIKRRVAKSAHRDQVLRVLEPVFDDMVNEVQRSLGYYKSLAREVKFERVLAIGSALKMTGLNQMLAAGLQYQVQTIRGLNRIQVAGGVDAEQLAAALPGCCTALGLLVQGAGQGQVRINMIPEEVALARQMDKKKPWLVAAAVGILVTAVVLGLGEFLHAQEFPQARGKVDWAFFEDVRKANQSYNSEFRAAKGVEDKLKALAEGGIPRDLLLQVVPVFTNSLHDDVYVTQLRVEWVEPAQVAALAPIAKVGTRARVWRAPSAAAAAVGPGTAAPVGGPDDDAGREAFQAREEAATMAAVAAMEAAEARRSEGMARAMAGGRGRRAGPAPTGSARTTPVPGSRGPAGGSAVVAAPPARTADSELVVRFACESRTISKTFIEDKVLPGLRNAQLPPDWRAAFKEVKMLGDVRDVYRATATGQEAEGSGDDVRRFLAFEGYAVVNLGQAPTAPK